MMMTPELKRKFDALDAALEILNRALKLTLEAQNIVLDHIKPMNKKESINELMEKLHTEAGNDLYSNEQS